MGSVPLGHRPTPGGQILTVSPGAERGPYAKSPSVLDPVFIPLPVLAEQVGELQLSFKGAILALPGSLGRSKSPLGSAARHGRHLLRLLADGL